MNPPSSGNNPFIIEAERFGQFVSGVTDYAIYMLSPEGFVSSWNAGAQNFKGYQPNEIIGQHFSRFYTDTDRASGLPAKALNTALTKGKFEDEGWRVRKDDTQFWASVVIDSIRDTDGKLLGYTKITRDITDRKKAAEALHASEERFRLLVQSVTDYAIYMLSPEGEITNWNAGAQRIKGFHESEVIGTHFSRFYTEEDRANNLPMKALAKAVERGSFESEGWRMRKDGSRFWAHVVVDPIKNALGELIGFAKVTRDVTERRATAKALEEAKEALFHSQKLEAIGKLTGGIAHDFNNLLSVIVNGLSILRMKATGDSVIKTLDSMERATSRGTSLTQQLLSFARQQPLKQDKHNLNRVISTFESVLRRANKNQIKLKFELSSNLPLVLIDVQQFEAALLNLIVNAGDAIGDRGTIIIETRRVELEQNEINQLPAGEYVSVAVMDNGEGIPPEIISKVIEPFFTTKPIGKGTGLGLSQVHGLVKQSNGDMKIISEPGKGTNISIYLPAITNDNSSVSTAATGHDKALVVDDQPDVLDMAIELFHNLGYDVLSATNGENALNILKRTPDIAVLFSDVVMPGMSGIDLGHQARKLMPTLKVILTSGYADPALRAEKEGLNDFEFINKPYRISEIIKKLR